MKRFNKNGSKRQLLTFKTWFKKCHSSIQVEGKLCSAFFSPLHSLVGFFLRGFIKLSFPSPQNNNV